MRFKIYTFALVAGAMLALTACADTREAFGLSPKSPDEFAVVDHPPLTLPPDYALRPPRPGIESATGNNPAEKAAKALYGDDKMKLVPQQGVGALNPKVLSPSEQALVTQSGATNADRAVRSQLAREGEVTPNKKLLDDLLFWKKPKQAGTIIDPAAEAKRLEQAKKSGQPVTSGATPAYEGGKEKGIQ
jgi:hypothetical protein